MSATHLNLDRQAVAQTFPFGTTSAGGDGLVTINKGTSATSVLGLDVKASGSFGGDLTVGGNLNITGSINEASVTTLSVTDFTIRANKGGSTPADNVSGLEIEGSAAATIAALLFNSASATKWSMGTGGDVVGSTATQTLTNKTIGGGQISGDISGNAANVTGTVAVANGGTGQTSFTAYGTIVAGTTSGGAFQVAAPGTSGWVLTSNGGSAAPTFQAFSPSQYQRSTAVSGTQDSSNKVFTIANAVSSGSEQVFINGQLLMPGSSNDYVISGTTVTFQAGFTAPSSTDVIRVYGTY